MNTSNTQLSVIVPTLNESAALGILLGQLKQQRSIQLQIIVADGGSKDGTDELALTQGVELSRSAVGRGRQMNTAVRLADAPFLLFLHADSQLTDDHQLNRALLTLQAAGKNYKDERTAGHFRLCFRRRAADNALAYRYYERKSALNRPECTNGDQVFLLARAFFDELHGFDESLWFLEDQRLAERIHQTGRWITLPGVLETSARRFEKEGLGRRMVLSALIMNFHSMGLDEFFHHADTVYRDQDQTGRLRLAPIFKLIHSLNREAGIRVTLRRWHATGHYVLSHAWQPFFFLDVALGKGTSEAERPCLRFYDRIFRPVTNFIVFEYVTAGLTWIWYRISWAVYALQEHRER
ncbi:MAG: TIGR04283 family arsenosugar biosynthesis glycosyltransferase [Candidatus Thiodiazotropha sp. (ex Ustalcina ferruginea)]|nr:TIGR04283 family arsenosugar biosynthesis glycosyltransferase [Candidatus Thiodiazotropha sp. (ex Ustalcina ferruginea)]